MVNCLNKQSTLLGKCRHKETWQINVGQRKQKVNWRHWLAICNLSSGGSVWPSAVSTVIPLRNLITDSTCCCNSHNKKIGETSTQYFGDVWTLDTRWYGVSHVTRPAAAAAAAAAAGWWSGHWWSMCMLIYVNKPCRSARSWWCMTQVVNVTLNSQTQRHRCYCCCRSAHHHVVHTCATELNG